MIGAGFAGLFAVKRLRDDMGLVVRGIEAGGDVGGTWYWNRYPGARCDSESTYYSFSFDHGLEQDWTWTELQPEILAHLSHTADRFDLRRSYTFDTRLTAAHWHGPTRRWNIPSDDGSMLTSQFVVTAVGCLSAPQPVPSKGSTCSGGQSLLPRLAGGGRRLQRQARRRHLRRIHWHPAHPGAGEAGSSPDGVPTDTCLLRARPQPPSHPRGGRGDECQLRRAAAHCTPFCGGAAAPPPSGSGADLTPSQRRADMEARWMDGGPTLTIAFDDIMINPESNEMVADFVTLERIPVDLEVGLSAEHTVSAAAEAYREARAAFRFSQPSTRENGPYRLEEGIAVRFDRLMGIDVFTETMTPEVVERVPDVHKLDVLIEQGGPDMLATLDTIVAANSVRHTARILGVHHNSVAHRVAFAERRLGFSVSDNYGRCRLFVALMLRRMRNTHHLVQADEGDDMP